MRPENSNAEQGLRDFIDYLPANKDLEMIEIGSFLGESTVHFGKSNKIKRIWTIDPFERGYDDNDNASSANLEAIKIKFFENILPFGKKIIHINAKSENLLHYFFPNTLDLIYIDGNHRYEYVKQDILLSIKLLKPEGLIAGHDYNSSRHPGIKKAVNEILGKPDKTFLDKSWIKKLKN